GATQGVRAWTGIWSLVTTFVGFLAGGWLAAKASSLTKAEGRLHGLVVWGLGTAAIFYLALSSTTRMAQVLGTNVTPGLFENATATAAVWALIAAIVGLIGGIVGGQAGAYQEIAPAAEVRRAA